MTAPKVAIIGRRNVGKSTLFNTFVESQKSLVSNIAGTTRDRFEADCIWRGMVVRMIDTGGLDVDLRDELEMDVVAQANTAIKDADLILFLVDAKVGPQPEDLELARALNKSKKPIIVVANKADNQELKRSVEEKWQRWPMSMPFPVSAKQHLGTGDLLDQIYEKLTAAGKPPSDIRDIASTRVAVLGRPNVGKSSLLNAVLGEKRFIASPMAHTTREPNDVEIEFDSRHYVFIDTAGVRKMAKVRGSKSELEVEGVERSLFAVKRADVVLFVLDVTEKIEHQDKHLAGLLSEEGASVIIVANKWDLVPDKDTTTVLKYEKYIRAHIPTLNYAPIVFVSALTGQRVTSIFKTIDKVFMSRFTQLTEEDTAGFISQAISKHKPSRGKGVQHPEIVSFTQLRLNPPKFALQIKQARKDSLSPSYIKFLANRLRESFDFTGTPIVMVVRGGNKKKHVT